MDAIESLLQGKQHVHAQKLLAFHRKNRTFLPLFVAELRLLKDSGQRAGSADAIFNYLRWTGDWRGVDEFEVSQNLSALASRVCTLLWPDINGMLKFRDCTADDILDTHIRKRGARYGARLIAGKLTPVPSGALPVVPTLARPRTVHEQITYEEAATIIPAFRALLASAPNPNDSRLLAWLRHVENQPEIFALMERTLQQRQPECFSARSLSEYGRWSIRRAAASNKHFTLRSQFTGLYCRAVVMLMPQFNGRCRFQDDGKTMRANQLLGCRLADEPINGEPYRRLIAR